MKKPRRASLGIATALITTLVATTAQTTRAQADSALANITGFQTTNISISSEGCKAVPVTMYVSTTDPSSFTSLLTTHIYRNGREVDYTWFSENKPDTWLWCSSNGFGTFRLGPSDGSVYTDSGTYAIHDSTVGYVKVKAKSIQSVTRTSRYRGYVWVSGVSYGYNTRSWFGPPTSGGVGRRSCCSTGCP